MSNISVDYDILNQKQTPAFYASSLATRPAFGFPGRIFIDTDTPSSGIYRDTGSAWVQVADPGAGTTGTLQQVTTNGNTTTNSIQVQGIDFSDGAGTGLYNIAIGNQTMGANTTGNNNIGIGYQTLKFNTTGALNVAVGNTALVNNTTGSQNTAVGQLALYQNTTGSQNTALGNATLQNNTTGTGNVAIGHASLVANTTANYNTAIGQDTLRSNTTGTQNVAIGYLSLFTNIIGNQNVAIGNNALQNSTASQNTAIGYSTLINNTTGANSTAVGNQALQQNTTGTQNTAIGSGALANNTTANYNTAIGVSSLGSNTTASFNTAIGHASLQLNTTGANNTALGFNSLNANTTGANNTAIGLSALSGNTTASGNTAIGSSSLLNNTTGANNTAIGYNTLAANTTSNNNTALGFQSLQVSTGAGNTAVGVSTLNENTTGFQNSALGISALQKNTTGNYNTGIGNNALNLNTTGQLNTTIGYNSGSAITTGSNNTIIGAYAGTTTLASNIVLSDGAGNVRLFSDANGLIGINQAVGSTIGGQLDIHSTQTYALVLNGLSTSNAYTAFSNASVGKWRIGNTYNAGANSFDIYNLGTSSNALSINSTSNVVTLNSYPLIDGGSVLIKLGSNTSTSGYTGIGAVATGLTINLGAAGTTGSLLFNTGASYSYTFPAATGTLALTSDLGSYLPLAGGTLTGALNGTSATFTSTLTIGSRLALQPSTFGYNGAYKSLIVGSTGTNYLTNSVSLCFGVDVSANAGGSFGGDGSEYFFRNVGQFRTPNAANTNYTTLFEWNSSGSLSFYQNVAVGKINAAAFAFEVKSAGTSSATFGLSVSNSAAADLLYVRSDGYINTGLAANSPYNYNVTFGPRTAGLDAAGGIGYIVSTRESKGNIESIKNIDFVNQLNPVKFNYRKKNKDNTKFIDELHEDIYFGFIADEVEQINKDLVFYDNLQNGSKKLAGVHYNSIIAILTKSIQELNEKVNRLYINHYGQ